MQNITPEKEVCLHYKWGEIGTQMNLYTAFIFREKGGLEAAVLTCFLK